MLTHIVISHMFGHAIESEYLFEISGFDDTTFIDEVDHIKHIEHMKSMD